MSNDIERGSIGGSFDDFLKEDGIYDTVQERAVKAVIALELSEYMKDKKISKAELARRLNTSPSQVGRVLDPDNDGTTIRALSDAAQAVGRTLRMELV